MYDRAVVASGHHLVSNTAAEIMKEGGNAFDAIVAAGFASSIAESALNSLGGGGFLLGRSEKYGQELFFDFFVDTPGTGRDTSDLLPDFFPVTVTFSGSEQDFNIGLGSVAVPGTLKGLIHVQERLGRMTLKDVLAPAIELAGEHTLNKQQAHFLKLLYPIMTLTAEGRALYEQGGVYAESGAVLKNPECARYMQQLAEDGGEDFYLGDTAARIHRDMEERGGLLTRQDLARYRVHERKPLKVPYRGFNLVSSPEPSMGGTLIALSISIMEKMETKEQVWGSGDHLLSTVALMQEVEKLRGRGVKTPDRLETFLAERKEYEAAVDTIRTFTRGTTHISVADRFGNCGSMTCSNGEGSGYFAPGTGVMLNNMMGEDDLHPEGFHSSPPGERVWSMMSPSLLMQGDRVKLVLGSGGSKRIRTAISQVLSNVVDFGHNLQAAVEAPRLFWDGEMTQVEPGFSDKAVSTLKKGIPVNVWDRQDVYFGGVHAVIPGECGAGDPRRGGAVSIVRGEE